MRKTRLVSFLIVGLALLALSGLVAQRGSAGDAKAPDPAAVERARKTVRMLDDVYKSAIVLITDKYVHTKDDYPAGRIAVRWFDGISKKGWHEVRLIDATGEPYSPTNVAQDEFDKEGLRLLKSGKDFHDQIVVEDGKPYLRAITPVPVVMDKCVLCHSHYKQAKKGEPIGALTYKVLIE